MIICFFFYFASYFSCFDFLILLLLTLLLFGRRGKCDGGYNGNVKYYYF